MAEWLLAGRLNGRDAGRGLLPLLTVSTIGAAGVLAVGAPAAAQDYTHPKEMGLPEADFERPDPDAMRVEMANGLAAYVAADHRVPLVTLTAFVAAGSAHGAPGEAALVGEALRSGPASMSTGAFHDALDRMTAEYSVTVGREEIEITLDVPVEDAWAAMELLAATLADPAFGPEGAEGVESLGDADAPQRATRVAGIDYASSMAGAIALFENRLFRGHVFGRTPSTEEMAAARRGGVERFHRTHFVPANTVLAVAGDVRAVVAATRLKEVFESWDGGPAPEPVELPAIATDAPRQVLLGQADKLQGWIVIGHELPPVPPEDEAALHVMDYVLGAYHLDSRLFRESREKRGLTNDNSSFLEPGVRGPGSYSMRTYGRPEAVRLLVDITFRELERIRETLPTEDELFVAKGALVDGLYVTRYSTGLAAVRSYALEWLRRGGHDWSEGYRERIRAVTAEDVQEAATKYLHPERMIVAVVGPLGEIAEARPIESEPRLEAWGEMERVGGGGGEAARGPGSAAVATGGVGAGRSAVPSEGRDPFVKRGVRRLGWRMLHESREASAAGSWLSVASALMIGVLVFHGPLAPTLEEQMTRIAGAPLRWSVVHWTAAAALSFHVVVGLLVLTSGSRLTSSGWTLSAWALYTVGALWTVITAVVETTVIASAAAAGAAETFEAWWSFAEGMGSGFSFLALAVAVIAGHEARSGDGIGPTWAAWLGTVAGVGSFTGWALGIWMGIPSGNLLWAVSSMVMMAWTLWFGVGLARGASGAPHASPTG